MTGDSAGGGLALSLKIRLRELGTALPDGAILLSPWTDLAVKGASVDTNQGRDRWFSRAHLQDRHSRRLASSRRSRGCGLVSTARPGRSRDMQG